MRRFRSLLLVVVLVTIVSGLRVAPVAAETEVVDTSRITVSSTQANGSSGSAAVSADGSTIVYWSYASNLVDGDTNGYSDVFMYDVATATTSRISKHSNGAQANGSSVSPAVSADGSTILYQSVASNLVDGDTGFADVFMYDVATATTSRISVDSNGAQANGSSVSPAVSADGSTIVYRSDASNLVDGDTNGYSDVFVHDVATATTSRISRHSNGAQANGTSISPAVSADGSTIVYHSGASNLVDGDTNGYSDVFIYDVATATTSRISRHSNGAQANGTSGWAAASADGSTIVYWSDASNLVDGDTNSRDVFMYDVATATTSRISVDSNGAQADGPSYFPAVSADGSTIVYHSYASNLVIGDSNGYFDVFAYDVATEMTTRVSVNNTGTEGNAGSEYPAVSGDGSIVVYESDASDLVVGDTNAATDILVTRTNRSPLAYGFSSIVGDNAPTGSTVGTVAASDPDSDPLTFAIIAGNHGEKFAIGDNGTITTAGVLESAVRSSYGLTVEVSDGSLSTKVDVTIEVTATNPFIDDDDSIFEADIKWLAAQGITRGCNPPVNDRFCPDDSVTRGQMAAFLVRALNLTDDGGGNSFGDDDGSIFEADIAKLAAAGITNGCNPPLNTMFCPDNAVTRGQMAAFLVRALGYTDDGGGNLFVDDDDSIFAADIDRLATAGVTRGCNPPVNDRFCPTSNVTRGQMAAFLHRALG